jgi:hypothetical protein
VPQAVALCSSGNGWTGAALRNDLLPVPLGYSLPPVIESVSAPPR